MTTVWRLLVHGPVDGALNMAIDRAVQLCREAGSAPPTLRLYRWARPTVTLGRFQPASGVDLGYCTRHGIDVVRRFTGGRGVLHVDELTYSVVARTDDGIPRGTAASYQQLCSALVESYRELGVDAELTTRDRGESRASACYLQATQADLSVGHRKLSGSAQVWSGSTVLQHGSFAVSRIPGQEVRIFRLDDAQASRLADCVVTLSDVLGYSPSEEAVASAAIEGFERALDLTMVAGELSALEAELATELLVETAAERIPGRGVMT